MKNVYAIIVLTGYVAALGAYYDQGLFGTPVTRSSRNPFSIESEVPTIGTLEQFRAHLEAKRAKYQAMLQKIEQEQASDEHGTKEKHEAWSKRTHLQIDGPPAYIYYERNKDRLRKKIHNVEAELNILKSCDTAKTKRMAAVPAAFRGDFMMACKNFITFVGGIPVLKQGENRQMDTRGLRVVFQQFEKLKLEQIRLNNLSPVWSNSEDKALHDLFIETGSLLLGVIDLLGPWHLRAIRNVRAIDIQAKKALESDAPGRTLIEILRKKIEAVARFNGRYAPMLNEVITKVIDPALNEYKEVC